MNNIGSSKCELSANVLSYMYGELATAKCSTFEAHLLDCGDCTDEFAAISIARYEVYDWKQLEFDPLETPVFVLPMPEPAMASGGSWVDRLRSSFSHSWAVPGIAFAGLAIISVFAGMYFFTVRTGSDMAAVNSTVFPVSESTLPAVNKSSSEPSVIAKDGFVEDQPERAPRPVKAIVRRGQKQNVRIVRRSVTPRADDGNVAKTPNRTVPTLNEFAEDEDTSLRLAQLFEDVDTRD